MMLIAKKKKKKKTKCHEIFSLLLQKFDEAANCFYEGVQLDPESKELVDAFRLVSLSFQVHSSNFSLLNLLCPYCLQN